MSGKKLSLDWTSYNTRSNKKKLNKKLRKREMK